MSEVIIEPGQRWRSRDKRDQGLIVTVLAVEPMKIKIQRYRKTWVRRTRFRKDYIGPLL